MSCGGELSPCLITAALQDAGSPARHFEVCPLRINTFFVHQHAVGRSYRTGVVREPSAVTSGEAPSPPSHGHYPAASAAAAAVVAV